MEKYPVKYSGPRDDGDDAEQPTKIRCRQCGNESYSSLVICPSCGRELVAAPPRGLTYGLPIALIALFFIVFISWSSRDGVNVSLTELLPGEGGISGPAVELEPRVTINETAEINVPSLVPEATTPVAEQVSGQVALASATQVSTEAVPKPTATETATALPTDSPTDSPADSPTVTATVLATEPTSDVESAFADETATATERNVITVANLVATLAAAPTSESTETPTPTEVPVDGTATTVAIETTTARGTIAAAARLTAEAPPTTTPTASPAATTAPTESPTNTTEPTLDPTTTTSTDTTEPTAEPSATEIASNTPAPSATIEPTSTPSQTSTPTTLPTRTPVSTRTKTATPRNTNTPTSESTATVVPPTETPTTTPSPTVSPTPSPLPIIVHEIKGGDTLLALARQYDTTVVALMEENNLSNDDVRRLRPGQELIIPSSGDVSDSAVVVTASGPPNTPTATPEPEVYIMKAGDNPLKIALRYGISVEALLAANGLTRDDATRLRIGTELLIPGAGTGEAAPANTAQNQKGAQSTRRIGTVRLDAPILLSPEDQTPMSCRTNDSLVWAPVPFLAPEDSYLLHVGFVSAVSENGEPTITWILEQPRESTRTSWDLDTDYCSLAPQELGRQWRWYVEVLDKDGTIVSSPSPIWAFSWN